MTPTTNGANGRTPQGRFAPGNSGGPGNPHARRVAALRAALLDAVTDDDLRAVVAKLVELARGGDLAAIRELFDRLLGKAPAAVALAVSAPDDACPPQDERRARLDDLANRLGLPLALPAADASAGDR